MLMLLLVLHRSGILLAKLANTSCARWLLLQRMLEMLLSIILLLLAVILWRTGIILILIYLLLSSI